MIEIRSATLANLEDLTNLFDDYRVWYRKISDKSRARTFLKDRLRLKDAVIYIALEGEESVGFTQLYPSFSSTKMQRLWILNDLYVKESKRGNGISKLLISQAKEHCEKTKACGILLETERNNDIGNRLYPSTGFNLESNHFYFWSNDQ